MRFSAAALAAVLSCGCSPPPTTGHTSRILWTAPQRGALGQRPIAGGVTTTAVGRRGQQQRAPPPRPLWEVPQPRGAAAPDIKGDEDAGDDDDGPDVGILAAGDERSLQGVPATSQFTCPPTSTERVFESCDCDDFDNGTGTGSFSCMNTYEDTDPPIIVELSVTVVDDLNYSYSSGAYYGDEGFSYGYTVTNGEIGCTLSVDGCECECIRGTCPGYQDPSFSSANCPGSGDINLCGEVDYFSLDATCEATPTIAPVLESPTSTATGMPLAMAPPSEAPVTPTPTGAPAAAPTVDENPTIAPALSSSPTPALTGMPVPDSTSVTNIPSDAPVTLSPTGSPAAKPPPSPTAAPFAPTATAAPFAPTVTSSSTGAPTVLTSGILETDGVACAFAIVGIAAMILF